MTTLDLEFLEVLEEFRGLIPKEFGFRPYTVSVVKSSTDGNLWTGENPTSETVTPILEDGYNVKVRTLSERDYFLGAPRSASLEVGPITPSFDGGGTSLDVINPPYAEGTNIYYLVEGPGYADGGSKFVKTSINTDKTLKYMLYLQRASDGKQL